MVLSLYRYPSQGDQILETHQYQTDPVKYKVILDIANDGKTIETSVVDVFARTVVSDLPDANLSLTLKASSDGITFNDITLNGEAYELDDEFLSSSHIKVELNDVTDNLNPILLGLSYSINELPGYSNDYTINFTEF